MPPDITAGSSLSLLAQEELQCLDRWQQNPLAESLQGEGAWLHHLWPQPRGHGGKGSSTDSPPISRAHSFTWQPINPKSYPAIVLIAEKSQCSDQLVSTKEYFQQQSFPLGYVPVAPQSTLLQRAAESNLISFVYRQYYPIQIPVLPYSKSTIEVY